MEKTELSNTIRVERAKLNITQTDLSKKVGVSLTSISNIESNRQSLSLVLALKMAKLFDVSIHQLFKLKGEEWI